MIAGDPTLRSPGNIPGYFLRPSFSFYRPLRSLSYHFDYRYWGLNPFGYRLTSILLHALCVLALFQLLKTLGTGFRVRAGAALIFLLHPAAIEPVVYLSSRAELLGTLSGLLFLLAGARFVRSGGGGKCFLSLAFLGAAFLSKESFLVLPLLLPVVTTGLEKSGRYRRRGITAAAFLAAGAFAVFRFFLLPIPAGPDRLGRLLAYPQILIKAPEVFLTYLRLLLLPVGLSPHHPLASAPLPSPARLAVQLAAGAGAVLLLLSFRKRGQRGFPGAAWFLIALLPVSNLYPLSRIIAEKYLYFPLAGAAWLAAELLLGPDRKGARFRAALFGAALLFFLALNLGRQPVWRSNYTLWKETAARSAPDPLILFNWGLARVRAGDPAGGLEELERAEAMLPGQPIFREKIADVQGMLGRHREALEIYRELLEAAPASPQLLLKAGFTYESLGQDEEAEKLYGEALARAGAEGPGREARVASVYRELAALKTARGDFGRAAEFLEAALTLFPGDRNDRRNLALLYQRAGRPDKAREISAHLPEERTEEHLALFRRAREAEEEGQLQKAARLYYRALELEPAFAPAYFELGGLLAAREEYEAAEQLFRAGLELEGDDFRHHTNLGTILQLRGKYTEAARAYRRSLELEESFVARYNLGFLYLNRLSDPARARPHLEAALELAEEPEQKQRLTDALEEIASPRGQ